VPGVCDGPTVTPTRSAKALYHRAEKCSCSACRFYGKEFAQITVNRVADEVEDQLNDPFAGKYFSVVAICVGNEIGENLRNKGKLPYVTGLFERAAVHYLS